MYKNFLVYLVIAHLYLYENMYGEVFEVADNKSAVRFSKLKMVNPKWRKIFDKFTIYLKIDVNRYENIYLRVFEVADYESVVRFSKFKMANPIWRKIFDKFAVFLQN